MYDGRDIKQEEYEFDMQVQVYIMVGFSSALHGAGSGFKYPNGEALTQGQWERNDVYMYIVQIIVNTIPSRYTFVVFPSFMPLE